MRFTCLPGCTLCCRQPGFVYLSDDDLSRAAAHLGMTPAAFEARYVFRTRRRLRFRKRRGSQCPFLEETGCALHPAKPTQCRAFPFWPEIIADAAEAAYCPGIGQGPVVPAEEIRSASEEMCAAYPAMY